MHSPQFHLIITQPLADRRDWRDTWGKGLLGQDLVTHPHKYQAFLVVAYGFMDNRYTSMYK